MNFGQATPDTGRIARSEPILSADHWSFTFEKRVQVAEDDGFEFLQYCRYERNWMLPYRVKTVAALGGGRGAGNEKSFRISKGSQRQKVCQEERKDAVEVTPTQKPFLRDDGSCFSENAVLVKFS